MHEPTAEWLFVVIFFFCSASLLSLSRSGFFFLLFHNSAPRHISLCGPEQHKQFSDSLCLDSHVFSLLASSPGVVHVRWLQLHLWTGAVDGGQVRREERGPGVLRRHVEARGAAAAREKASDAGRARRGGGGGDEGGGVRVDPSKSLGSFSRLKLLAACKEQGLCFGVSHPGECLASGRFSEESNTGEK